MRNAAILLSILIGSVLTAQKSQFIAYGEDQNLNAKFIYDICQLSNNDLLIATEKGLFSFDGYLFSKKDLVNEQDHTFISEIYVDDNDRLWVGNSAGQIWKGNNGSEIHILTEDLNLNSEITDIFEDNEGMVWITSRSNGILIWDGSREIAHSYYELEENIIVNSIHALNTDRFFLGTNEGLLMYAIEQGKAKKIGQVNDVPNSKVTFTKNFEDQVHIGTADEGLYIMELHNSELELIEHYSNLSNNDLRDIEKSKNDVLWITSTGNGLIQIQAEETTYHEQEQGLGTESVSCVFKDAEQNLWIGTYGKGLFRKYNSPFKPIWKSEIENSQVRDIEFYKGQIYLATAQGIELLQKNRTEFNSMSTIKFTDPLSLAVYDKYLFVATARNGIHCLKNGAISKDFSELRSIESVNHIMVHDSDLYISTSTGGLIIYSLLNGTSQQYNTQNGLTHNEVNSCFVDGKDKIWLAMSGAVLNAIDNGKVVLYGKEEGILQYDLSEIVEDNSGSIWVSSDGGGIYKLDSQDLDHFQKNDGSSSNYMIALSADDQGRIWSGSTNSISKVETRSNDIKNYNTKENIHNFSISKNGLRSINDSLFICSNNGLYIYDESNDIDISIRPMLDFTSIQINDSVYSVNENIDLPYGKYSLRAHFKTRYLADQQKVKYRFFLDGQEEDYGPVFSEASCYYPGLLKGEQKLKIICTDLNGNWIEEPLILDINIDIPFYQKPLFVALMSFGVLLLMTAFVVYREQMNKKLQSYLSTELDLRTVEVRKQKDELAEKNQEIQDSIIYAERIQRSMLSSIKLLEENSKDHFIFYQPRDIVSGDFYWFAETEDHFIFAGADCTGHGVPGSLMSMICISELDKAVKIDQLINPNDILQKVDVGLRKALHQNEESSANDGMDIALCVLNKNERVLKFSGAGRPCLILRGEVLEEIKGSREHIGGGENEKKTFEVHNIELSKGLRIYLSSDGYVDQFGGLKGKKYLRKRFRELVVELSDKPLNSQLQIFKNDFQNWKGDLEQVDDVLVLGVDL